MNNLAKHYIGLDVGGSSIKFGIFTAEGTIVYSSSIETMSQSSSQIVLERISLAIEECLNYSKHHNLSVTAIGIGIPGVVLTSGIVVTAPNFKDFTNIDIQSFCESKFPYPIFVDNDATVAGLAEAFVGSGKSKKSFLFVTLGTGVGGCIISNGSVFRGESNGAGEIGHIIVYPDAEISSEKPLFRKGVLEEFIGREGILNYAKSSLERFPKSYLTKKVCFDVSDISYGSNNLKCPHCLHIIGYVGKLLGIALSTALNILDIHTVIIGGGIAQLGDVLFYTIQKTCKERCLPSIAQHLQILPATFSNDSGIVGAAYLAKQ